MAAIAVDEEGEKKLKELGVKDSKLLTREKRQELFTKIRTIVKDYRVEVIEASAIDIALTDPSLNLNWLEADTAASMVNELQPSKVIVDCPSPNISAYRDYFVNKLDDNAKSAVIMFEHKADARHLVVAAASIVAKVIRDLEVDKIKEKLEINCGSGYMTDPLTIEFLNANFDKHDGIFRKNWASYQQRVRLRDQRTLSDFD